MMRSPWPAVTIELAWPYRSRRKFRRLLGAFIAALLLALLGTWWFDISESASLRAPALGAAILAFTLLLNLFLLERFFHFHSSAPRGVSFEAGWLRRRAATLGALTAFLSSPWGTLTLFRLGLDPAAVGDRPSTETMFDDCWTFEDCARTLYRSAPEFRRFLDGRGVSSDAYEGAVAWAERQNHRAKGIAVAAPEWEVLIESIEQHFHVFFTYDAVLVLERFAVETGNAFRPLASAVATAAGAAGARLITRERVIEFLPVSRILPE